jgi:hypothetical protein
MIKIPTLGKEREKGDEAGILSAGNAQDSLRRANLPSSRARSDESRGYIHGIEDAIGCDVVRGDHGCE